MTCRNCSGVSWVAGIAVPMPALLTRMSTWPNSSMASATRSVHDCGSETSVPWVSARRPAGSTRPRCPRAGPPGARRARRRRRPRPAPGRRPPPARWRRRSRRRPSRRAGTGRGRVGRPCPDCSAESGHDHSRARPGRHRVPLRLRADADAYPEQRADERAGPDDAGYVEHKVFSAEDGERVTP